MHYLISGLAKSGTTRLFTQVQDALLAQGQTPQTHFEPWEDAALAAITSHEGVSLTKILIGQVAANNPHLPAFDRHVLIYRDPRDQFLSTLLYLFYDFQEKGDAAAFASAYAALEKKVADPVGVSALDLYDEVAKLAGRPGRVVFSRLHEVQSAFVETLSPFELSYEALIDGVATQELGEYLNLALQNDVTVASDYARVSRSKSYGEWKHWLTAEDQAWVNAHWGEHLRKLGYSLDRVTETPVISERLSLDYVAQFRPGD